MDKITLEFTKEEIRQLQKVCFSSWYHEPPGSEVLVNASKFFLKFLEIMYENYNRDKISLEFSLEEIRRLAEICFSSLCYVPVGCDIANYSCTFYDKFSEIIRKVLSKH